MRRWLGLVGLLAATGVGAQMLRDPAAQLAFAQAQLTTTRQRALALERQARTAADEAERARLGQAATGARIQLLEAEIGTAEARLALLRQRQRAQEQRLAAKQQPIVKLMGALQTMARRPAAAALVQPGSLGDAVHLRAVLGTMRPEIIARTSALRAEAGRARRLRVEADAIVAQLQQRQRQARIEHAALSRMEAERRRRSAALADIARIEGERVGALAEQAATLEQLVGRLGQQGSARDRLASLPGPSPRPARITALLPADSRPPPIAPIVYRMPVNGPIARGFGERLASGVRSRGVTIAARPGALVVAPAAGRISFAGLYRGYGAIAILDHGGGHVSLITGLAGQIARTGDTVAQGGPIGRAGPSGVSVELRKDGQATDLSQFVA